MPYFQYFQDLFLDTDHPPSPLGEGWGEALTNSLIRLSHNPKKFIRLL